MKKLLIMISLCSLVSLSAFANGDTSDGCGLGWQVTDKKTWIGTTTRGTTNAFVPPTFGMTSGTIGCAQHPIAKNEVEGAVYAHNNFESLKAEVAEGQGEYISGLAQSMGCDSAAVPAFTDMTQQNSNEIIGSESGLKMFDSIKAKIQNDGFLASHCNV
jgi:hypothetical protein